MIAVVWAAGAVTACGTERQASTRHPADNTASAAKPAAHAPVSLTALSDGMTIGLFRGQSVAVVLRPAGLSWHVPTVTGRAVRRTSASGGYPGRQPARATFLAASPGRAILSSFDDIACLHARPFCVVAQCRGGSSCSSRGRIRESSSLISGHRVYRFDGRGLLRRGAVGHPGGSALRPALRGRRCLCLPLICVSLTLLRDGGTLTRGVPVAVRAL
jgi:hypothetical protein